MTGDLADFNTGHWTDRDEMLPIGKKAPGRHPDPTRHGPHFTRRMRRLDRAFLAMLNDPTGLETDGQPGAKGLQVLINDALSHPERIGFTFWNDFSE